MPDDGLVRCYECEEIVPLDDAVLISGDIDEEFKEELEELVRLGLVSDDGEEGDFYVCVRCRDKLLGVLDEILGCKSGGECRN